MKARALGTALALVLTLVVDTTGTAGASSATPAISLDRYLSERPAPSRPSPRHRPRGVLRWVNVDVGGLVSAVSDGARRRTAVMLTVAPDLVVSAAPREHTQGGDSSRGWSGRIGGDAGSFSLTWTPRPRTAPVVVATVTLANRVFMLEASSDDGAYALYETESTSMQPAGPAGDVDESATATHHGHTHQAVGPAGAIGGPFLPVIVDIVVLHTDAAARNAVGGIGARIDHFINRANEAHANSQVPIRFRKVAQAQTATAENAADMAADLRDLRRPANGRFDEADWLRAAHNADLVALVGFGYFDPASDRRIPCGFGSRYANGPAASSTDAAFTVTSLGKDSDSTCDDLTMAHELGHNLGGDHDWNNLHGMPAFNDAHGYQYPPGRWADVMAYTGSGTGCDPCTTIPHWSNPHVTYGGVPTGVGGGDRPANNARVFTATAETIDAYRPGRIDRYGPAATSLGSQRMELLARGTDDGIHHRRWSAAGGWGAWSRIHVGATTKADPDVVSSGPQRLDAVHLGGDGAVWWATFNGTAWSGWSSLGGILTSAPSIVSHSPGELHVFGRGIDGALWTRWTSGGVWQGWSSLGGMITSDPDVSSWGSGRADVFARGADGAIWHRARSASGWLHWESIGHGILTSAPTAVAWGTDRIDVFARGADGHLWHNVWGDNRWYGWYLDLGGVLTSAPDALSRSAGTLDVFGRGTDGALWRRTWTGTTWQPWTSIG